MLSLRLLAAALAAAALAAASKPSPTSSCKEDWNKAGDELKKAKGATFYVSGKAIKGAPSLKSCKDFADVTKCATTASAATASCCKSKALAKVAEKCCSACATSTTTPTPPTPTPTVKCSKGKYLRKGDPKVSGSADTCVSCAKGTYSTTDNSVATACKDCPTGKWTSSTGRGTACPNCPNGKYSAKVASTSYTQCINCVTGRYSDQTDVTNFGICKDCPGGKWSSVTYSGETSCKSCYAGYYSDKTTKGTRCLKCPTGKSSSAASAVCVSGCLKGKYKTSPKSNFCISCPNGKVNPNDGSTSSKACRACGAGTIGDKTKTKCTGCGYGRYLSKGSSFCNSCQQGKYADQTASTSCKQCVKGKYGANPSASTEAAACKDCTAGKYTSQHGTSFCSSCPFGKSSKAKATSCVTGCSSGQYKRGNSCASCPAGRYQDTGVPAQKSCKTCTKGKYAYAKAAACTSCAAGTFAAKDGAVKCDSCGSNTYMDATGGTTCKACPKGKTSTSGSLRASDCGDAVAASSLKKGECMPGQYKSSRSSNFCGACPTGKVSTTKTQTGYCISCPSGRYAKSVGGYSTSCDNCATGRFNSYSSRSACSACPKGRVNPKVASTSSRDCTPCATGSSPDASAAHCVSAGADRLACPPGRSVPSASGTGVSPQQICPKIWKQLKKADTKDPKKTVVEQGSCFPFIAKTTQATLDSCLGVCGKSCARVSYNLATKECLRCSSASDIKTGPHQTWSSVIANAVAYLATGATALFSCNTKAAATQMAKATWAASTASTYCSSMASAYTAGWQGEVTAITHTDTTKCRMRCGIGCTGIVEQAASRALSAMAIAAGAGYECKDDDKLLDSSTGGKYKKCKDKGVCDGSGFNHKIAKACCKKCAKSTLIAVMYQCGLCGPSSQTVKKTNSAVLAQTYTAVQSCSDGIQNGKETSVDCGGDCGACPSFKAGAMTYFKYNLFSGSTALNTGHKQTTCAASLQFTVPRMVLREASAGFASGAAAAAAAAVAAAGGGGGSYGMPTAKLLTTTVKKVKGSLVSTSSFQFQIDNSGSAPLIIYEVEMRWSSSGKKIKYVTAKANSKGIKSSSPLTVKPRATASGGVATAASAYSGATYSGGATTAAAAASNMGSAMVTLKFSGADVPDDTCTKKKPCDMVIWITSNDPKYFVGGRSTPVATKFTQLQFSFEITTALMLVAMPQETGPSTDLLPYQQINASVTVYSVFSNSQTFAFAKCSSDWYSISPCNGTLPPAKTEYTCPGMTAAVLKTAGGCTKAISMATNGQAQAKGAVATRVTITFTGSNISRVYKEALVITTKEVATAKFTGGGGYKAPTAPSGRRRMAIAAPTPPPTPGTGGTPPPAPAAVLESGSWTVSVTMTSVSAALALDKAAYTVKGGADAIKAATNFNVFLTPRDKYGNAIISSDKIAGNSQLEIRKSPTKAKTATKEVQTATTAAAADDLAGTFTLTFGGQTTAAMAKDITAAAATTAINALSTVTGATVTVGAKTNNGYVFTVTFAGALPAGDAAIMTCGKALLTGTTATCVVAEATKGVKVGDAVLGDVISTTVATSTLVSASVFEYKIAAAVPNAGSFQNYTAYLKMRLTATALWVTIGSPFNITAAAKQCPDTSEANQAGNQCICKSGFAMMNGKCASCAAGQTPNADRSACERCPAGKYSATASASNTVGTTRCSTCADGQEPKEVNGFSTSCSDCQKGDPAAGSRDWAGTGGSCTICLPGEVHNSYRTRCICDKGFYNVRDNYVVCHKEGRYVQAIDLPDVVTENLAKKLPSYRQLCAACPACMTCPGPANGVPTNPVTKAGYTVFVGTSMGQRSDKEKAGTSFQTKQVDVFSCHGSAACTDGDEATPCTCKALDLDVGNTSMLADLNDESGCTAGQTGPLCALCDVGWGRNKREGACIDCTKESLFNMKLLILGGAIVVGLWFAKSLILACAGGAALSKRKIEELGFMTDVKILVGYFQIMSQQGKVLDMTFPVNFSELLDSFKIIMFEVGKVVKLECLDVTRGYYSKFWMNVVVLPAVLGLVVFFVYIKDKKALGAQREKAAETDVVEYIAPFANFRNNLFLMIFIIYPKVSQTLFNAFDCEQLNDKSNVLVTDMSIDCDETKFVAFQALVSVLILAISIGIPAGMLVLMTLQRGAGGNVHHGSMFESFTGDYKSSAYYFESFELFKKLILTGLIIFVGQGSVGQVFCAGFVSYCFLIFHFIVQPYEHLKSNLLKAVAEMQLFLVFYITLVLRINSKTGGQILASCTNDAGGEVACDEAELLKISFYDNLLIGINIFMLPVAFVLLNIMAVKKIRGGDSDRYSETDDL